METRNVCAQVPSHIHRQLRVYTARHDTCLAAILESLLEQFVEKVVVPDEAQASSSASGVENS
jgi:hypothetical protein